MDIGKLIKEYREIKGIKQTELAKMLGVTQTMISNWENGEFTPSEKSLKKIASVIGCNWIDLLK